MILRKTIATCLPGAGLLLLGGILGGSAARADEVPAAYRETIDKGLDYLAKSQRDGHWGAGADGNEYPVSMTGLAGIALLMEGSSVHEGKYSGNLRKAVDWLMDQSHRLEFRDGLIFSDHSSESARYMYGHGFATLFLACAYGDEDDHERRRRLKDILVRAVKYIGNAQSTEGGWYYTSRSEGGNMDEGSVTITQLQALRACRDAGIAVPKEIVSKAIDYLRRSTSQTGGVMYRLGLPGDRPALTAAAISCSFSAGEYKNDLCKRWLKFCQKAIPVGQTGVRLGHDEYTQYYYAQAVYNLGDDGWDKLFGTKPGDADR